MAVLLVLMVLSTVFFLAALVFSVLLSRETGGDKYWLFFVIATLGFALAHGASKGLGGFISGESLIIVREIGEITGAFSLFYATYGLYASMKKIRQKIGDEL